jgi:hypothetical protein
MTIKIPTGNKIYIPTFPLPRPSKIFSNLDFWFAGNPGYISELVFRGQLFAPRVTNPIDLT